MSAVTSVATFDNGLLKAALKISGRRLCLSWKQVVSPFSLGLVGLAITVALAGFGYKLALYHRHPAPPLQGAGLKLWTEPPNASIAAVSKLKRHLHLISSPQALANSVPRLPRLDRTTLCRICAHWGYVLSFDLPIPLRSPPLLDLRTA